MTTQLVQTILNELVYALIISFTPILCKYIIQGVATVKTSIDTKTKTIKDEALAALIANANEKVAEIVIHAVQSTNQTFVNDLKAEGKFSDEAKAKAFSNTYDTVKSLITDETAELIRIGYGDIEVYIQNKIESAIGELK
ncbi:MAG: hypothetical protein K5895_11910 [Lachnospiraceae bacterium]|nr:hypothetical protein [Lachnospiraceae bacterium]